LLLCVIVNLIWHKVSNHFLIERGLDWGISFACQEFPARSHTAGGGDTDLTVDVVRSMGILEQEAIEATSSIGVERWKDGSHERIIAATVGIKVSDLSLIKNTSEWTDSNCSNRFH
jgi:hypothetical protein